MCFESTYFFPDVWSIFSNPTFGAFSGAFFTFLFVLWTYRYTKKHELWMKHKRATVATEQLLNRHLNEISDDMYLAEGSIETLGNEKFTYNEFHPLPMPDYLIDFQNLDLMDRYTDYQTSIIKVNNGMHSWNKASKILWDVMISGKIDPNSLKINCAHLIDQAKIILRFLTAIHEDTYTFGAYIRVFMRKDKFDWLSRIENTNKIKLTEQEIRAERAVFVRESRSTMKKSRERIKKIMKG